MRSERSEKQTPSAATPACSLLLFCPHPGASSSTRSSDMPPILQGWGFADVIYINPTAPYRAVEQRTQSVLLLTARSM